MKSPTNSPSSAGEGELCLSSFALALVLAAVFAVIGLAGVSSHSETAQAHDSHFVMADGAATIILELGIWI